MTYAPTNPVDVPPYNFQTLIASTGIDSSQIKCAQAFGSEVYAGCHNGDLLRFGLQMEDPNKPEVYGLISSQPIANGRPVDEIVLLPSISRALILSDSQVHFYTLPSLDVVPYHIIRPIRHVVSFVVDDRHLRRPVSMLGASGGEAVDFCVIKKKELVLYTLRDKLVYLKELNMLEGCTLARRIGKSLCIADRDNYNIVDLDSATVTPVLPLNQAGDPSMQIKPSITVVADFEFLVASWTGMSSMGVFLTTSGDPTRGTLDWPSHPDSVCYEYPYIAALLPNKTIEVHNIETQGIMQVLSAPEDNRTRMSLMSCLPGGYLVPSSEQSKLMRKVPLKLKRAPPLER